MFCPFCGKENEANVKFCGNCGTELSAHNKKADKTQIPKYVIQPNVKKAPKQPQPQPQPQQADQANFSQMPKPPKPKKVRDYKKWRKRSTRAIISSSVSLAMSVILTVVSLVCYFAIPSNAYVDEIIEAPEQASVGDPTYDMDYLTKPDAEDISFSGTATEKQLKELKEDIKNTEAAIQAGEQNALNDVGELDEDNVDDYVSEVASEIHELYRDDMINDYDTGDNCLVIEFNSGIRYFYIPQVDGLDSGTDGTLKIATYQPCLSGYGSSVSSYMDHPDDAAEAIEDEFSMYTFDEDTHGYDDGEVDINALASMSEYNVILWHGHGAYYSDVGSTLVTSIEITDENLKEYYGLLVDGSLFLSGSNYLLSATFFENHVEDGAFDNSIVYLGTCSSGRSSRLAQAIVDKGAEAVYANTGTIHTTYNLDMMKSVVEGLCTTHDDGSYYNVSEALEYAKEENGYYDTGSCYNTNVVLYTGNESFALDWYEDHMIAEREVVMVLDVSGSMYGTPLDETKKAATAFVESVLDAKATVSIVEYATYANVLTGFTRRQSVLNCCIESLDTYGTTNIYDGLYTAHELLKDSKAKKKIVVLMSDGVPNEGLVGDDLVEYANELRADGIYVYTLGFFHNLGDYEKSSAQDILRRIADEGNYHDVADAESITYVFDDIAKEITGERRIYIRIACPVEVEVTYDGETLSKDNPRTDFGSLVFELPEDSSDDGDEDDYGYYEYDYDDTEQETNEDELIKIVRLKEGLDYDIEVNGTGSGSMDYTIGFMDENGEYNDFREFKNIKIKRSTVVTSKANYSDTTTLLVDEDGDGENDYIYRAEKDSKAEKKEVTMDWRLIVAIVGGALCALALVSLVVSIIIFNYSKKKLNEPAPAV